MKEKQNESGFPRCEGQGVVEGTSCEAEKENRKEVNVAGAKWVERTLSKFMKKL